MLPLDLHVLGLPLAFILSQDQTLHSKNVKLSPEILRHPKVPRNPNSSCALISLTSKKINVKLLFQHQRQPHRWSRRRSLLFILVLHCNTSKNVSVRKPGNPFPICGCKDKDFSARLPNIFFNIFHSLNLSPSESMEKTAKNFSPENNIRPFCYLCSRLPYTI